MEIALKQQEQRPGNVIPLCPVFKECGGCLYQNIGYPDELAVKEERLKGLFRKSFDLDRQIFTPIVPSPKPYHYRNRLDLKLKRTKANDVFIGFSPVDKKGVIPVDACFIADQNISDFIPELKRQAIARLPLKYKNANLTVRSGQNGKVFWGGIGRRSCQLPASDYFWTDIGGTRIFYSLDTFFQANSSILPMLLEVINRLAVLSPTATFFDLYSGVGLFGIMLAGKVKQAVMIEDNIASLKAARHNLQHNKINNVEVIEGKVEDHLTEQLKRNKDGTTVAMIDPPRAGLSQKARQLLSQARGLKHILYLSCDPDSLVRDLTDFTQQGWEIKNVIPFDFFPKTRHIETLVLLKS